MLTVVFLLCEWNGNRPRLHLIFLSTTNITLMLYALHSSSTSSSHKGRLSWLKQNAFRASHELTISDFVSCSTITFGAWSVLAWSRNIVARFCTLCLTSLFTVQQGSNHFLTPPFACKWRMTASTVELLRRLMSWKRRRIMSPRKALRTLSILSFCKILDLNILEHTARRNWSCTRGTSNLIACWSLLWEHTVFLKVFKHCSRVCPENCYSALVLGHCTPVWRAKLHRCNCSDTLPAESLFCRAALNSAKCILPWTELQCIGAGSLHTCMKSKPP